MRVIDFLQFIQDIDQKYQFYYQNEDVFLAVSGFDIVDDQVILATKKATQAGIHQWELVALLKQINNKKMEMKVALKNRNIQFYGLQIQPHKIVIK